jgi:tight adherence protein B
MTVQAATILIESGGNLIESFQLILETVRDRQRVTEKIRTATTQGKAQAGIISAMPFALVMVLASVSPDYIAPLFTWPTGGGIIAMGFLMLAGGVVWMRLILKIEV